MNFGIKLLSSVKNPVGILTKIVLYLQVKLGEQFAKFITLSLPIHDWVYFTIYLGLFYDLWYRFMFLLRGFAHLLLDLFLRIL